MDDFQICQQLRIDSLVAEVPIIMITALDDRDSRLRGIEAGVDDFVSKPFDNIELWTRMQAILRLNRYRRLLAEQAKFEWEVEQAEDDYLIVNDDDQILYANPQERLYLGLFPDYAKQVPQDKDVPISEMSLGTARKQYRCEPQESWATWPVQQASDSPSPRYLMRPRSATAGVFWLQVDALPMTTPPQSNLVCLRDATADIVTQSKMWAFYSLVSHKLRTPPSPLIGFLELLLYDDLSTLSEAESKDYIASSHQGALRLQDAILDIFRYMEVVNASKPNTHNRCNLASILDIISEVKSGLEIEAASITFHDVSDSENALMLLSCHFVELIFGELCKNTKKSHSEGSSVIDMNISSVPESVRIQVRDDGRTLSPE
ncbi:MAG: response regulator [Chloroflexota bacterium]|nr:response regulator [Chloroflexota bacterium]